jgi:hypothetical protein
VGGPLGSGERRCPGGLATPAKSGRSLPDCRGTSAPGIPPDAVVLPRYCIRKARFCASFGLFCVMVARANRCHEPGRGPGPRRPAQVPRASVKRRGTWPVRGVSGHPSEK